MVVIYLSLVLVDRVMVILPIFGVLNISDSWLIGK